eukprot:349604-Chlamydomonas_euryale.AAC.6
MRLLSVPAASLGCATIVAATSATGGGAAAGGRQSPGAALPDGVEGFHMPRYSLSDAAAALTWYHERGLLSVPPTAAQVAALHALSNGNARELRRLTPKLALVRHALL